VEGPVVVPDIEQFPIRSGAETFRIAVVRQSSMVFVPLSARAHTVLVIERYSSVPVSAGPRTT
jgi:hypothetical protein